MYYQDADEVIKCKADTYRNNYEEKCGLNITYTKKKLFFQSHPKIAFDYCIFHVTRILTFIYSGDFNCKFVKY